MSLNPRGHPPDGAVFIAAHLQRDQVGIDALQLLDNAGKLVVPLYIPLQQGDARFRSAGRRWWRWGGGRRHTYDVYHVGAHSAAYL